MKASMISKVSNTPANLVVIDSAVSDRDILISNLQLHATVVLLEAGVDGIAQLGQILSEYVGSVSRLHVVSHGFPGCLRLGTARLCLETFSQYEYALQLWARALSEDASVLLYGCQVAAEQRGQRFVQTLSRRVGAKVAASSSPVGHQSKNANWILDFTTSPFEPVSTFRSEIATEYEHAFSVDEAFSEIVPLDPVIPGEVGAVKLTIKTGNGNVKSSTFKDDSFVVENVGNKRIAAIYLDISQALFPDTVFDPVGLAGDNASRGLKFNSTGETGAFEPGSGDTLVPFYGAGGVNGYEGMLVTFNPNVDNGFNPGEFATFGVDIDPNSIVGLPQNPTDINGTNPSLNWDIGGVSGAELVNSQVHVLFTDGTTAVGELMGDGSQAGSAAIASQASPNKQVTLTVNGVSAGGSGSYSQTNIQVIVSGEAGDTARIVLTQGFIQPFDYTDPDGNPVNLSEQFIGSPFPANNALQFQTVDVLLNGTQQDITSLFDFNAPGGNLAFPGDDILPISLVASIVDSEQLPLGLVSDPIYLIHEEAGSNTAPTSSGIGNITVTEGADNTVIALFDIFDDAQDPDTVLTFEIVANTNASLFATLPSIASIPGLLTLDYAATGTGTTDITVRATDTEGLSVETTFNVAVTDDTPPPSGSSVRIEAEDYRTGTNGIEYFDSTAGNKGNADGFTDDVDVSVTADGDGEFHVSFIANSEFLTYDLTVPEAGQYDIVARVATSRNSARKANISIGNTEVATLSFSNTGGFSTWEDVVISDVTLPAGLQTLRVDVVKGAFNFNYLEIVPSGSASSNTAPTTTGIADIAVVEGTDSSVIELFDAFADAQSPDSELVYEIVDNTNASLFETVSIDDVTGQLTLNFAAGSTGSADLTISATDPEGLSVETTFTATVSGQPSNTAPTTSGIGDVVDVTGGGDRVIDLRSRFSDDQPIDQLQVEVIGNSNPGLFDSIAIDPLTGSLMLDYSTTPGNATLTVRGTDAEGESVETSFVASSVTPQPSNGAVRINAGGGSTYDPAGNLWQADDFFTSGQTFDGGERPITNADDNFRFDSIYQKQRTGSSFSYAIPVPNGSYNLNLHLSELVYETTDQRLFDVVLEGEEIFTDLDVYAKTKNAFLDGKDTARVLQLEEEFPTSGAFAVVEDGVLNLEFSATVNEAVLAGLEIIPVTTPQVVVRPSGQGTNLSEDGLTDSYDVVLTVAPTDTVTIELQSDGELTADTSTLVFTPENWFQAQTVTLNAVDDSQSEGIHSGNVDHVIASNDPNYQGLNVPSVNATIADNDEVPEIAFDVKSVPVLQTPTRAAWGPDGRLYVSSLSGAIEAYEFDDDYDIISTQEIDAIESLDNYEILGLAFNPWDTEPSLYVSHSHLEANGGDPFPVTEFSPYSGQVSILGGPDFDTVEPLITGIGVSNHDHGVNGLEFDNEGDLYIAVGGNTNAGIVSEAIGGLDESPLTASILKAEITKPDFNGAIEYELPSDFVLPDGTTAADYALDDGTLFDPADSQVFGNVASVVPGTDVSVYASGTRNPFDLTFTTKELLYATDNGANFNAGDASTGSNTQAPLGGKQFDELNLIEEGGYYGHPSRNRGLTDPRQNEFYGNFKPYESSIPGVYTEPIGLFGKSSTNGIDEYRSNAFGGQLRGNLIAQQFNSDVWSVSLSADGTEVEDIIDLNAIAGESIGEGLDIITGPGGAIIGVDLQGDRLTVAVPEDTTVTEPTAYDVFPWRSPAEGGGEFVIGGINFDPLDTQVFIGEQEVLDLEITEQRVRGTLPDLSQEPDTLLDVRVVSNNTESLLSDAFQPLFA